MLNAHTLTRFETLGAQLLKPIYADYSFANLPATLHYLLTGEQIGALLPPDCFGGSYPNPTKIVLLFIDSFGWQFWQRYAERSRLMSNLVENGVLTPISALFPSTTAASVSTLNLGCLPARHAVFEWNMYVPAYGETIQSLPFQTLGLHPRSCIEKGYDISEMVLEKNTMHARLAHHGVRSIQLAHRKYARSPYNGIVSAGAKIILHGTLPEALVQLRNVIAAPGRALITLYWAGLDTAAHEFGPSSAEFDAEVTSFWLTLDALLTQVPRSDTLFLFTADHGHVGANAADTLYVNERWPELTDWLAKSPTGNTIWPNGSPRDMFLHIVAERREAALELLGGHLSAIADVLTVEEALSQGLFGAEAVCPELRHRLGDLLILPHAGHFIWWREPGLLENPFHGHHGGLAAEELITVLGVAPC